MGAGGVQVLRLLAFLGLAPLLGPEPYGLIALATLVIAPVNLFITDAGWLDTMLRAPRLDDHEKASLFWLHVSMAVVALPVIVGTAPLIAGAFSEPALVPVLIGLATAPLAGALSLVPKAQLGRSFRFRELAAVELTSTLVGFVAAFALALAGLGVWALVALQVVTLWSTAILILRTGSVRYAPRLKIAEILPFARITARIFTTGVIVLIEQLAMRALIGSLFGTAALGAYVLARRLIEMIEQAALGAMNRVGLAHIGRSGRNAAAMVSITARVAIQGVVLTWPLFVLLIFAGTWLIETFVADSWGNAAPLLVWVSVAGMADPIARAFRQTLLGCGRANWIVLTRFIGLVLLLGFIGVSLLLDGGMNGLVISLAIRNWIYAALMAGFAVAALLAFRSQENSRLPVGGGEAARSVERSGREVAGRQLVD